MSHLCLFCVCILVFAEYAELTLARRTVDDIDATMGEENRPESQKECDYDNRRTHLSEGSGGSCLGIWVQKMQSFFNKLDVNRDGTLTKHEFIDIVIGRIDQYMDQESADIYKKMWSGAWDFYFESETKKDNLTVENMIWMHSRYFWLPHFGDWAERWFSNVFERVLAKDDQLMDLLEYTTFLQCLGVDPTSVPCSFYALDTSRDRMLDEKEFVKAGISFYNETLDTPAKMFWGPFPV